LISTSVTSQSVTIPTATNGIKTAKTYKRINMSPSLGDDLLAVDCTAAEIMGFDNHEIPHLNLAKKRLWDGEDRSIRILGDDLNKLKRRFKRPVLSSAGLFSSVHCVECGVCNGCLSAIRHSLDKLDFENELSTFSEVTVVSGRPMDNQMTLDRWRGDLILFGNCASGFQFYNKANRQEGHWIPGCPPHIVDLAELLIKRNNDRSDCS